MTSQPEGPKTPDPVELYKAVRSHELMLNEATSGLERAVVPPLLALNGGAAVAFLTLVGALGTDAGPNISLEWARAAIGAWVVGLLVAAAAGWFSALHQSLINKAHRLMREEIEEKLFPDLAAVTAPAELSPEERRECRASARAKSQVVARRYRLLWISSVMAFVVGDLVAVIALGRP